MYIGRSQQEEEKYLQTTIKAINELIEEFDGLSTEQDKEENKENFYGIIEMNLMNLRF